MTKMNNEATVAVTLSFERIVHQYRVKILHYHADNGLFNIKIFCVAIAKFKKALDFCGVNTHHQNGIAENIIQDVTVGTITSLLHT